MQLLQRRKERGREEENDVRIALKSFYGCRRTVTISIASPARAETTRDTTGRNETRRDEMREETKRNETRGFCRAGSRLLRFAVRSGVWCPRVRTTTTTATGFRSREVHSSSGRRGVQAVGREINEAVSPTRVETRHLRPCFHLTATTMDIYTYEPEIDARGQTRATDIVITHVAIRSREKWCPSVEWTDRHTLQGTDCSFSKRERGEYKKRKAIAPWFL
ncbi:hypothetical protein ACS0PU_009501 [Formica fusca]